MKKSKNHRTLGVILLIFLAPIMGSCSPNTEGTSSIVYGLTLVPSGIDPHLHASAELGIPLSSVYDTLVFQDPDTGEFIPGLAESWTISSDGLTYTFALRQDVSFHDGTPFDAHAVRINLDYTLNPENHSFKGALMLGPLDEIEVIDDHTISLHLSEPFAPLLDSLSQVYLGMASPRALEEWGPGEYQFHQVGTGPYRFVEYVPNDYLTLTRNPDYAWAPAIYHQQQATIETITFRFYEDPATRSIALESGEVDIIGEVPPHDAARLSSSDNFVLHPIPIPGQPMQFLFNINLPPTDDIRVRQALILAVDRSSIVETLFGDYSPVAQGPLAAITFGASMPISAIKYDPEMAKALLEEAGWREEGGSGFRNRDGIPLELKIVAPNWGSNTEAAQLIRAAWEKIGAKVKIEVAAGFGPLNEAQANGDYHAIGINFFDTDPDLILRRFYSSSGPYNWSGLLDPELDQWLIQASQASLDRTVRAGLYDQIVQRIQEQALLLPIRDYVNLVVTNNRIQGMRFSSQGWFPFLIDLQLAP